MTDDFRLANEAWEAYYRAQAAIAREFSNADIWDGLLTREYAVLHALSTKSDGVRVTELRDDVLLTQPGMSRLIARLETKGLVEREDDVEDARAKRVRLTDKGNEAYRRIGANVARSIARAMRRALDPDELRMLRDLSLALLAAAEDASAGQQAVTEGTYS